MEDMKFYMEYDEEGSIEGKMKDYIEEHGIYELESITIGCWEEAWSISPKSIIDYLVENKSKFPNLKRIHLGDIDSEECEISWINHTDVAPLLNEFNLEEIIIQGAEGLRFKEVKNHTLKALIIISGGISSAIFQDILEAELPNLEHLELYIGVDEYGFDGDISTLEPFMKRSNFPKLKYLGLKNSEIQDEICAQVLESDIIKNLEVLDLSLGTLSSESAQVILESVENLKHLKKLDLTYNYISDELIEKMEITFKDYDVELLTSKEAVYDEEDEWRYPYITE